MGGRGSSGGGGGSAGKYKDLTQSEVEAMQEQLYGSDYYDIISNAAYGYIMTGGSFGINARLREDEPLHTFQNAVVNRMDSAMKPLGVDANLTRYADMDYAKAVLGLQREDFRDLNTATAKINKNTVGNIIQEKAFMSTSYNANENAFTDRPVKMNIKAPKNTKGLYTTNHDESEIVLARNSKYVVTGARKGKWGQLEVDVVMLP